MAHVSSRNDNDFALRAATLSVATNILDHWNCPNAQTSGSHQIRRNVSLLLFLPMPPVVMHFSRRCRWALMSSVSVVVSIQPPPSPSVMVG